MVQDRYRKNQRIFAQGDAGDTVGFIREGVVKVTILSAQGKEAIVGVLRRYQFFGESCLLGASFRSATVTALADCEVLLVSRDTILGLCRAEPRFSAFFLAHLLARNERLEDDLIGHLLHSAEQRLARLLLLLADLPHGEERQITVPLSQEALAEMVGTTRSRVSTFMNRFRDRGLIRYDAGGRIKVYARPLLSLIGA